jgi:hypothetical protein
MEAGSIPMAMDIEKARCHIPSVCIDDLRRRDMGKLPHGKDLPLFHGNVCREGLCPRSVQNQSICYQKINHSTFISV